MNPIISLTKTGKMSASNPNSKISFNDIINEKISKAFCCDRNPDCGLMKLFKCIFFPLYKSIEINCDNENIITYTDYNFFESNFESGIFAAPHLKKSIIKLLCQIIEPIRNFLCTESMIELISQAYQD